MRDSTLASEYVTQHCTSSPSGSLRQAMVCKIQRACARLGPSAGRSWNWSRCLRLSLCLRGKGVVMEAVAERATPRVGRKPRARGRVFHDRPFAPRAQPQRRFSRLPRNKTPSSHRTPLQPTTLTGTSFFVWFVLSLLSFLTQAQWGLMKCPQT